MIRAAEPQKLCITCGIPFQPNMLPLHQKACLRAQKPRVCLSAGAKANSCSGCMLKVTQFGMKMHRTTCSAKDSKPFAKNSIPVVAVFRHNIHQQEEYVAAAESNASSHFEIDGLVVSPMPPKYPKVSQRPASNNVRKPPISSGSSAKTLNNLHTVNYHEESIQKGTTQNHDLSSDEESDSPAPRTEHDFEDPEGPMHLDLTGKLSECPQCSRKFVMERLVLND